MKPASLIFAVLTIGVSIAAAQSAPQTGVKKSTVPGITNFAQVETTVACAGAITPASVVGIKKMGFATIINLRLADEKGADIDAEADAAKLAGIKFVHLPMSSSAPDPAVADRFLKIMAEPGNRTGVHSLRQRKSRRGAVADQARDDRQVGQRSRGGGSHAARPDQPGAEDFRARLRPGPQKVRAPWSPTNSCG